MTTELPPENMTAEQRCDVQEGTIDYYRVRSHRAEARCEKLQKMYDDSQAYIKKLKASQTPQAIAEQHFKKAEQ